MTNQLIDKLAVIQKEMRKIEFEIDKISPRM